LANPISPKLKTGTIGELLVQLRLLQYGIQSAPPLKDSGNDLIALKGREIRLIQVRTTAINNFPKIPGKRKIYDLLAIVRLNGSDTDLNLDESKIYLIPKKVIEGLPRSFDKIEGYEIDNYVKKAFYSGTK
jgi:hypothetical protein